MNKPCSRLRSQASVSQDLQIYLIHLEKWKISSTNHFISIKDVKLKVFCDSKNEISSR